MKTEWKGSFLDGKTAARRPATIRLMQTGLEVTPEDGAAFVWPYDEIRQTQGTYTGEQVRLERGGELPEVVVVPDVSFLLDLHERVPGLAMRFHNPTRRVLRIPLTILAALVVIGISGGIYLWGIPAMATAATPFIPVSWEEQMGQGVVDFLAPTELRCTDEKQLKLLQEIVSTLAAPLPEQPYTFRVMVVNQSMINAFAAPGGFIVVFKGLLDQTQSAEELAGVLAHEMQHILKRHSTRAMLQNASTGILIAALTGDATGAVAYGLDAARTMGTLRYSRQNEEEADLEGMRMLLNAGIDPSGMISFFEGLEKKGVEAPDFLKYVSTHPLTHDRIEKLKSMASPSGRPPVKLIEDYDWQEIKKICGTSPG
jgi:predicted Zn-dependent protease